MRWLICGTVFGLVLGLAIAAPVARLFEQGRVKHFRLPVRLELEIGDAPPAVEATADELRVATARDSDDTSEPLSEPLSAILESREQVGGPNSTTETAQFAEALKQVATEEQQSEPPVSTPQPAEVPTAETPAADEPPQPIQPENPAICPPGAN